MPRRCVCCGRHLLLQERDICVCCRADLPETHFARLRDNSMSEAFNSLIQRESGSRFIAFGYATALFYYRGAYREISRSLKYHRGFSVGKAFSRQLAGRIVSSPLYSDVDAVVPVPLHWTRAWSRGYNQARIIAREIASALGVPLQSGLLCRRRRTRSQTTLDSGRRAANTRGAFAVKRRCKTGFRHILLVDDVYTTGATTLACEQALHDNFPACRVSVATLAFVEH